jgi:hypothetical protein
VFREHVFRARQAGGVTFHPRAHHTISNPQRTSKEGNLARMHAVARCWGWSEQLKSIRSVR